MAASGGRRCPCPNSGSARANGSSTRPGAGNGARFFPDINSEQPEQQTGVGQTCLRCPAGRFRIAASRGCGWRTLIASARISRRRRATPGLAPGACRCSVPWPFAANSRNGPRSPAAGAASGAERMAGGIGTRNPRADRELVRTDSPVRMRPALPVIQRHPPAAHRRARRRRSRTSCREAAGQRIRRPFKRRFAMRRSPRHQRSRSVDCHAVPSRPSHGLRSPRIVAGCLSAAQSAPPAAAGQCTRRHGAERLFGRSVSTW